MLMATDPPYQVGYDGQNHPASSANGGAENRNKEWAAYNESTVGDGLYEDFLRVALAEALDPGAPIYQWHAGTRSDVLLAAWEKNGVLCHQQIIWVKSRSVLTYADFMQRHEPCFYGWVRGNRPPTDRRPPVTQPTVWEHDQIGETGAGHPTQKPVVLVTNPIEWHTRPGQAIYEPFSGSGTAIIAAERTGRRCYAVELAPEFVDVAVRRWEEHTGQKAELLAGTPTP